MRGSTRRSKRGRPNASNENGMAGSTTEEIFWDIGKDDFLFCCRHDGDC